jgi:hypothetical protein
MSDIVTMEYIMLEARAISGSGHMILFILYKLMVE